MDTELVLPETLAEAHAVIREWWMAVQALRAEHEHVLVEQASLRERVAELERRLGQNSSNSSRPHGQPAAASADPPWTPPAPGKRQPSGRKAGGQPGHVATAALRASARELLPLEQVDQVVAVWPEQCQHCGVALPPCPDLVAAPPERHQVSELPPVQVTVTEYQMQRVRCPGCGEETRAALPDGVPTGAFGPHLQAAAALLTGRYHLSRRAVVGVLADLVGARVGLGSVNALCQDTSTALAQPVGELAQSVQAAPVAR
jgi:transposase